jgi:hypothetical protein
MYACWFCKGSEAFFLQLPDMTLKQSLYVKAHQIAGKKA